MMKLGSHQKGSTVALAVSVALAAAVLIGAATRTLLMSSHQVVYFNAMNKAYRLAETGMIETMGRLAVDPTFYISSPALVNNVDVPGEGVYSVLIQTTPDVTVMQSAYYFKTTAHVTVGGKTYGSELHTHLRISNAADYFWACNEELWIAQGTDASNGRVYARILKFMIDGAKPPTKVLKAEFMQTLDPPPGDPQYGPSGSGDRIEITEPYNTNVYEPKQVGAVVFPQVTDSDMNEYRRIADNGNFTQCVFKGPAHDNLLNVYPPGYVGPDDGTYGDPLEGIKSNENKHHVWYCPGDLYIGNVRVFGQVLFAARGNIHIQGNIYSDSNGALVGAYMPGAGSTDLHRASSTAHQAILISKQGVQISSGFHPGTAGLQLTQTIEAMILAPHGRFQALTYNASGGNDDFRHQLLSLVIKGSIIVGQQTNVRPNNFANVFDGVNKRVYQYMPSLKTNPPLYTPALAELLFSTEGTIGTDNIF